MSKGSGRKPSTTTPQAKAEERAALALHRDQLFESPAVELGGEVDHHRQSFAAAAEEARRQEALALALLPEALFVEGAAGKRLPARADRVRRLLVRCHS